MRSILYFDYAALAIICAVLVSVYIRKTINGNMNLLFVSMTILSALAIVSDISFDYFTSSIYKGESLDDTTLFYSYLSAYAYILFRNTTGFLFLIYTFSLTRTMFRIRKLQTRILLSLPYAFFLLVLFSNLFTNAVFEVCPENGYSRGPAVSLIYFSTLLYLLIGFWNLIINKSLFSKEKWIALISMYLMTFLAVIYQYFNPAYLVEMFSGAMSFLLITLVVVRPEEVTDQLVGELCYKAYQTELHKLYSTQQPVHIAAINIKNAIEIRNFLKEESFGNYMKKFIERISSLCKKEGLSYQIYSDMPDNIYVIIDNMDFKVEEKMLEILDFKEMDVSSMRLLPRLCLIKFLKDVKEVDDVLYLSRNYGDMIGKLQRFARAEDLVSTREYKIRRDIDAILTRGIRNKSFELYYQPIYSLKDKQFLSAEALVRLNDPEYGFIPPSIFIPLAENRGLIHQIGDITLEDVYEFVASPELKKLGVKSIDVNLSVAQCMRSDIIDKISSLEKKYEISRRSIMMEITETYLGESIDDVIYKLTEMGYDFALDDYGTGYSNIHRLLELPLSIIKIDKCLVDGMKSNTGYTILKSTIDMLHSVGFRIIVEGVEDEKRFLQLEEMGIDYIQGYYFSKPLPKGEFLKFVETENSKSEEK